MLGHYLVVVGARSVVLFIFIFFSLELAGIVMVTLYIDVGSSFLFRTYFL